MNFDEYFIYDDATGNLIWKARPRSMFGSDRAFAAWNGRFPNKVVGGHKFHPNGRKMYVVARIGGRLLYAHRIIWEMQHGPIPDGMWIDHANRNEWDNRMSNLRIASPSQNGMNKKMQSNNSTGAVGVYWCARFSVWQAKVFVGGSEIFLGSFDDKAKAIEARRLAVQKHYGEYAPSSDRIAAFPDLYAEQGELAA